MDRTVTIYTDGAARGNPGPSASGFMAYENGKLLNKHFEYNGRATNNYAEYKAVALALKWCASNGIGSIELYSDNELVVRQLNGEYKLRSASLMPLNKEIRKYAAALKKVDFNNVGRENIHIKSVDRSLNVLLDGISEDKK